MLKFNRFFDGNSVAYDPIPGGILTVIHTADFIVRGHTCHLRSGGPFTINNVRCILSTCESCPYIQFML